jgi:hypothetical protein
MSLPTREPYDPAAAPPPTVDRIMWRVQAEALVTVLGRKKGEAFIRAMATTFAAQEAVADIIPIRPGSYHADLRKAQLEAAALFRGFIPSLIARLRPRSWDRGGRP